MLKNRFPAAATVLLIASAAAFAFQSSQDFSLPFDFQPNTPARASEVNSNFAAVEVELLRLDDETEGLRADLEPLTDPANVIEVATEGGDFSSIAAALASITDSSEDTRYLVRVGPGVFDEPELCVVPPFVHLQGSGQGITLLRTARSANAPSEGAAALALREAGRVSELSILNQGSNSGITIGVIAFETSRATVISRVTSRATGSGTGAMALHATESDLTVEECRLEAAGASILNAGAAFTDSSGPFAQPRISNSTLRGEGPTTGVGLIMTSTAATIEGSTLDGDMNAVQATVAGISRIQGSKVRSLGFNPWGETNGSAALLSSTTEFTAGNPVGFASSFVYVHCFKSNHSVIVNGQGSSVQ